MSLNQLKSAFTTLNPMIGEEEWDFIAENSSVISLKRKANLFEEGQIQKHIGFINRGLIREYFIDKDGNENTVWFFQENSFVTDYSPFLRNSPTKNTFSCLEPTEVVLLPREIVLQSYDRYPALDRFGRLIAEKVLIQLQERIDGFHFLSAEERYLKYINAYPDLFQRISLTHLSTFLGIKRPSLSRIRKNLS